MGSWPRSSGWGLAALLLTGLAAPARAQLREADAGLEVLLDADAPLTPPADRASIGEALTRARARSPTAVIAAAELRRAAALVEQARAASLPTLTAFGEYARLGPDSLASGGAPTIGGSGGQFFESLDNWLAGGQLNLPLLALPAWVQWAHSLNDQTVARWTEQEAQRELAINVAHAYLSVINQKHIVELNQRASQTDRAHYDYTQRRRAGGLGTPLDELRALQQFESDRSVLQSALFGLERAQEALGVLLGEDHPVDTTEEPRFEPPAGPPLALEEGLRQAQSLRPDLRQAVSRGEAARQVDRDAWADYLPTVAGSFQPTFQTPPFVPNLPLTWSLILTLNWTIYDGGLRYGLHKERAELRIEAESAAEGQRLQADSEIRAGFKAVSRTEAALQAARAAAAAAHRAVDVATLQYQAGATTNIDVVDAERRAHDADTTAALAQDGVRQARLDLLAALGRFP